jgi:hypothetical protein
MAGPRFTTARLLRANRSAAVKARRLTLAAAEFGLSVPLLWAANEPLAEAINWLRLHSVVCAGLAAIVSAVQVARRRVLTRAEFSRSWLAAAPIRPDARWEALMIETSPAITALVALLAAALACGLVLIFTHASAGPLFVAWASLSAGVAAGVLVSFALPPPKPLDLPPGSRYVPHSKTRRAAKIRPSLSALGAWPVRQMFAWAQPKIVARTTVPICVMLPLGTTADRAMSVLAISGVTGALLLLTLAAASISGEVRLWTAPLPLRPGVLTRVYLLPTLRVMAGAGALESLLLLTFDVGYAPAAAVGFGTAVIGCLAAVIGAQAWRVVPGRIP